MENDIDGTSQFIVTAISDRSLETFQETIEANNVLEAQIKFQEMWPLASITSIHKA